MNTLRGTALLLTGVVALTATGTIKASAHSIAGKRIFPATVGIDDPGVSDELSLPTYSYIPSFTDTPSESDFSFDFAKRITPDLALSIGDTYSHLGSGQSGFQNLELGLKYLAFVNAEHEFMASSGLVSELGGTGAASIGADPFSTVTPNIYFGKGFGDLPVSLDLLRPFAITGQFGYAIPMQSNTIVGGELERNPSVLNWGFTLQYSLPYLNGNVREVGGPEFMKHLVPIVEAVFQTPVANTSFDNRRTTGTIQPGLIYMGSSFQVTLEAVIPVNAASGHNVGVIAELHFFLDDIFPNSIGKPIFP